MGHLILISNHISKFSELPEIPDEVELQFKKEAWIDYEKEILNETNQRDNKPLGQFSLFSSSYILTMN